MPDLSEKTLEKAPLLRRFADREFLVWVAWLSLVSFLLDAGGDANLTAWGLLGWAVVSVAFILGRFWHKAKEAAIVADMTTARLETAFRNATLDLEERRRKGEEAAEGGA